MLAIAPLGTARERLSMVYFKTMWEEEKQFMTVNNKEMNEMFQALEQNKVFH